MKDETTPQHCITCNQVKRPDDYWQRKISKAVEDAQAQRDRLEVALKTIEGHHNENDSWRDIAREALKECGK